MNTNAYSLGHLDKNVYYRGYFNGAVDAFKTVALSASLSKVWAGEPTMVLSSNDSKVGTVITPVPVEIADFAIYLKKAEKRICKIGIIDRRSAEDVCNYEIIVLLAPQNRDVRLSLIDEYLNWKSNNDINNTELFLCYDENTFDSEKTCLCVE